MATKPKKVFGGADLNAPAGAFDFGQHKGQKKTKGACKGKKKPFEF